MCGAASAVMADATTSFKMKESKNEGGQTGKTQAKRIRHGNAPHKKHGEEEEEEERIRRTTISFINI